MNTQSTSLNSAPEASTELNSAPGPIYTPRSLLKELQEKLPAFRDCLPLSIGVDKQVIALYPEVSRKTLRVALGIHTNSLRYLKTMEKASNRFDLDGKATEAVTEEHRNHASTVLRERAKKVAEQRKAQRVSEAAARAAEQATRAAEEAARQHAEKLQQLTQKFARKN